MNRLFSLIRKVSFFICFSLILTTFSTLLVSYSLKGKEQYLMAKNNKKQIDISYILEDIENYTINTRNNTTYIALTTSLDEQENIALLTRLYQTIDNDTYPLQVILYSPSSTIWATINLNGISISK